MFSWKIFALTILVLCTGLGDVTAYRLKRSGNNYLSRKAKLDQFEDKEYLPNGSILLRVDEAKTWSQAKDFCEKEFNDLGFSSTYLASIENYKEYKAFRNLIGWTKTNAVWLGGTKSGGEWHWVKRNIITPMNDYSRWLTGYPKKGGNECVVGVIWNAAFKHRAQAGWYNIPCTQPVGFICKLEN